MWIYRLSTLLIVAIISLTLRALILPPLVQALQAEKLHDENHHASPTAVEQQTSRLDP